MPPSQLKNMPPLAVAATECRLFGTGTTRSEINQIKDRNCTVRLHGNLVAIYRLRAVGGPNKPSSTLVREDPPRKFDAEFELYNPDTFFRSYLARRDTVHQMLMQTPHVNEFDLSADNWTDFFPHDLATDIVDLFRRHTEGHDGVAPRFNIDMSLIIRVEIVYNEPKALLLACKEVSAVTQCRQFMPIPAAECCVCMEDLAAAKDIVRLPCSHCFHRRCILPWFYKVATCPMCRHDMGKYLVAFTNTAKGKFPGLEP